MVLSKLQFAKACARIGFSKHTKVLWRAFDKNNVGHVTVYDLDAWSAMILAKFCFFTREKFSSTAAAFHAFKKNPTAPNLCRAEFLEGLRAHGFTEPGKVLFHGLDRNGNKKLTLADVTFLDKWKPLPFLLCKPNYAAMDQVKRALLLRYKNHLKAWRQLLDRDGSNRCNWCEFQAACKTLGVTNDIAGAWRAFDEDMSGCITLLEIDPASNNVIVAFKNWADDKFGSMRSAFGVFDDDHSNSVTKAEFCRSCRTYGFRGDPRLVFKALDIDNTGTLSMKDVVFLDAWMVQEEVIPVSPQGNEVPLTPSLAATMSTLSEAATSSGGVRQEKKRMTIVRKAGALVHVPSALQQTRPPVSAGKDIEKEDGNDSSADDTASNPSVDEGTSGMESEKLGSGSPAKASRERPRRSTQRSASGRVGSHADASKEAISGQATKSSTLPAGLPAEAKPSKHKARRSDSARATKGRSAAEEGRSSKAADDAADAEVMSDTAGLPSLNLNVPLAQEAAARMPTLDDLLDSPRVGRTALFPRRSPRRSARCCGYPTPRRAVHAAAAAAPPSLSPSPYALPLKYDCWST